MAYDYYELKLGKDYVLGLFQDAVEQEIQGTHLENYKQQIMDWYEDQLEYDELDWEISSIPSLVYSDITQSRMVVITEKDEEFNEIDKLYEQEDYSYVGDKTDLVARICFKTPDNSGHAVYLCQKEV